MMAIAKARGIDLGDDAVERTLARYDGMAPDSTSSLQRDIIEGKPSELEAQAGAIGDQYWARALSENLVDSGKVRAIWTSPGY